jgi:hypothetical protein
MATLKAGEDEVDATSNNQIVFTVIEGDRFLYDNINHNAYLSDGRFGFIDPNKITGAHDPEIFKFDFSDEDFVLTDDNALIVLGTRMKIDFRDLVKRILQQDPDAFISFVTLSNKIGGEASETYESLFWKLLNDWSDVELSKLLKSTNANSRTAFIDLMLDMNITWPIEDPKAYYAKYYPRVFDRYLRYN